jgi:hypothetical protein
VRIHTRGVDVDNTYASKYIEAVLQITNRNGAEDREIALEVLQPEIDVVDVEDGEEGVAERLKDDSGM